MPVVEKGLMSDANAGLMPCVAAATQSMSASLSLSRHPEASAAAAGLPLVLFQLHRRLVTTQQEAPVLEQKRN